MASTEHPVAQTISSATIGEWDGGYEFYAVGRNGVTRIEATTKSGMHADIPYIRVWQGDVCLMEVCQHNILGVYFDQQEPTNG